MEQIIPLGKLSSWKDCSGKTRFYVRWKGNTIPRARLNMMNYLHTERLPSKFHVHHINGDTECDEIWNLALLSSKQHACLHHPATFATPWEYEKNRRLKEEVQEAIRQSSLRYYHKHKDEINANPEKQQYKKEWYMDNKDRILDKMQRRYKTDEVYRKHCLEKAKAQKVKLKEIRRSKREGVSNEIS